MLDTVLFFIEAIKIIGYYSMILSYNVGKIIVNGFLTCFEIFNKFLTTMWTVLVILQEDLLIFLFDFWNKLLLILHEFHSLVEYLGEFILSVFTCVKLLIVGTSDAIIVCIQTLVNIVTKVFSNFGTLIATIKHLVVLFGSGVWFAITIIPLFIVYVCMMTTYYIGRAFEELKSVLCSLTSQTITGLQDIFTFVTDVPLESLAGLVFCLCITYVVVKFHIILFSKLNRFIRNILELVNRYIVRLKMYFQTRRNVPVEQPREASTTDEDSDSSDSGTMDEPLGPLITTSEGWKTKRQRNKELLESDDKLCVICMERNKCILTMPCRHLCTCKECNLTLRSYNRSCPICRCYINYTIHVY